MARVPSREYPRRAAQQALLGVPRSDVPWSTDSIGQTEYSPEQIAFLQKGGQIKKIGRGKRALNNRQIELLTRREYAELAVETSLERDRDRDRAGRRDQRG